jgi:trimeric autotransporter adhesin
MKKCFIFFLSLTVIVTLIAQDKMYIFKTDKTTLGALISKVDSLIFSSDGTAAKFIINGTANEYAVSSIDSLTFGENSTTIGITYNGSSVSIFNPLAYEGVQVAVNGADVTVTSTIDSKDITYQLSGTTTDGTFKVYSDRAFNLQLSGVDITNANGPAINIQCQKSVSVTLVDGTTNALTDGTTYATAPNGTDGEPEDQKAVFFSEAKLTFSGTGALTINGKGTGKHALCTDETLEIDNGTITVSSALKDGLHGGNGFILAGGTVKVTSTGSCVDGEYISISKGTLTGTCTTDTVNAVSCDSTLTMTGGSLALTISGAQSKGIKSDQAMTLNGGTIQITASGKAALVATSVASRYNPAYCTAIKSDASITASGTNITINHTGAGGKGISAGTDFTMTSGTVNVTTSGAGAVYVNSAGVNDYYNSTCITSDNTLNVQGGTLTATPSGMGSKGLASDGTVNLAGGTITITASGAATTYSYKSYYDVTYCAGIKSSKAVNIDGATVTLTHTGLAGKGISTKDFQLSSGSLSLTMSGGAGSYTDTTNTVDSYNSTCITTDGALSVLGGTLTTKSTGAAGKGLICNGALTIGSATTAPTISITTSGAATNYAEAKAVKADGAISLLNGTTTINSANDGMKSETSITIATGTLTISNSYEALEAPIITFNSGTTSVTATNDCINGTKGTVSGGTEENDGSAVNIKGGVVMAYISGTGDCLDCNGNMTMSGGTVVLQGPASQPELALDYNGSFTVTGGLLIASGPNSGSMIEPTSSKYTSSNTYCMMCTASSTVAAGTLFHVQDDSGTDLVTYKPTRAAYYLVFISSALKSSTKYSIYTGGSYSTTAHSNGLYTGGTYTAGTLKSVKANGATAATTFTLSTSTKFNTITL